MPPDVKAMVARYERRFKDLVQEHTEMSGYPVELHAEKSKEKEVTNYDVKDDDKEPEAEPRLKGWDAVARALSEMDNSVQRLKGLVPGHTVYPCSPAELYAEK